MVGLLWRISVRNLYQQSRPHQLILVDQTRYDQKGVGFAWRDLRTTAKDQRDRSRCEVRRQAEEFDENR